MTASSLLVATLAAALTMPWATAFAPSAPLALPKYSFLASSQTLSPAPSCSSLSMSMQPTFDQLTQQVSSTLGLQSTDFTASLGAQSWNGGAAEWLSEASPQYLTGVTYCTKGNGSLFTINIWMGPSYDVPNMLLTFGEQQPGSGVYKVEADYVTRGAIPIGSDPQILEKYYGEEIQQAWLGAFSNPGSMPLGPSPAFDLRLLVSPARIAVGGLSLQAAETIARQHVERCLGWLSSAQPIPARNRGAQNLRDDKLRQFYFKGKLTENTLLGTGSDLSPETMAAAETGPVAEAYVGGGS